MAKLKQKPELDINTEEKIKNAARLVFHKKGFSATRTRDIAEEAGINLALLNYYFRSKEKLFDIIMLETMQLFLKSVAEVFNDEKTTLEKKVETLAHRYIDLLLDNPEIPLFLLTELRTQPNVLVSKIGLKEVLLKSSLLKQFQQGIKDGKITPMHPLQFIMNLIGMIVFPFVAKPVLMNIGNLSDKEFEMVIQERKLLIPKWVKAILKAK